LIRASEFNELYLRDDALPRQDREEALFHQAEILYQLGRFTECQTALDQLLPNSSMRAGAMLLAARLQLQAGDRMASESDRTVDPRRDNQAREHYVNAQELVRKVTESASASAATRRQASYLLGLACRRLGENAAAEQQFNQTVRTQFGTAEAIAAGLEQAELQQLRGDDAGALVSYGQTLRSAAETNTYAQPWLDGERIRERVEAAITTYLRDDRFEQAASVAESLYLLFPDARTLVLRGTVHESWARNLTELAAQSAPTQAKTLAAEAGTQRRQTGRLYEQLSRLRIATREYPSDVWRSGENYFDGQDYDAAVRMYRRFLENESAGGRPAALLRLGEAELSRNNHADALPWLNECIEFFPKSPHLYRARMVAAQANLELGHTQRAQELLALNLESDALTPASSEWRESLYLLGRIHFQEGMRHEAQSRLLGVDSEIQVERQAGMAELRLAKSEFESGIRRLDEAIQREPNSPHAMEARYMLAQARLQSAKLPKKELLLANIETIRVALRREVQGELTEAAQAFEDLKSQLIAKQEKVELNPVEQRILRNCYFGRADVLFDLGQFEDAIQAYASATNRYQHEPESLEAYVQIANCHRRLNRPADSRRTLDQAKLILSRIRPEADFLATTRYDRQEWGDLLNWLSTL
jgi:tetratricopeptide (TPR) repeat protein